MRINAVSFDSFELQKEKLPPVLFTLLHESGEGNLKSTNLVIWQT